MNKFLEEIQEQPEALKQTFCYYRSEEGKKSLKTVCALWKSGEYDRIVFTGMGSSYFTRTLRMTSAILWMALSPRSGAEPWQETPCISTRISMRPR